MSKRLKNVSGVDQQVVFRGKSLSLPKGEEMEMDDEVAAAFLTKCAGLVQEAVVDIGGVFEDKEENVVWIANMTGDPDAVEEIDTKVLVGKGQWGTAKIKNPMKEPRTIRRTMGGEMKEHMGKAGLEGLNCIGVSIEVPPYQRRKLPTHIGKWFLQRSAYGTPGAIIKSRAKSPDEPDMKWELDDMRLYLQLIDPSLPQQCLGQTYKRLKSDVGRMKKSSEDELRRKVRQAKELLMKRLHKRLADPRYRLPTREEFEEFKAANIEVDEPGTPPTPPSTPSPETPLAA